MAIIALQGANRDLQLRISSLEGTKRDWRQRMPGYAAPPLSAAAAAAAAAAGAATTTSAGRRPPRRQVSYFRQVVCCSKSYALLNPPCYKNILAFV